MKRIYSLLLIVLILFGLSSCFLFGKNTTYPDMVEYGRQEVLDVAKEKYSIKKWLFNTSYINGETVALSAIKKAGEISLLFIT